MQTPADLLQNCYLYGILDLGYVAADNLETMAKTLVEGGADIVQLRAKDQAREQVGPLASRVLPIFDDAGIPFIINDFPRVCREVGAGGVHVGQDDTAVNLARSQAMLPEGKPAIVGKSTHSLEQARAAVPEGADYIGFGPLHATLTKPGRPAIGLDHIAQVHDEVAIPIFCIGGVTLENLPEILQAGARRVVIVSAILQADKPVDYMKKVRDLLGR